MDNLQAERAVLGACLLSAKVMDDVSEILTPDDFYDYNNQAAYRICLELYAENKPIDLITFQAKAEDKNLFERLGGQAFLAELVGDITVEANAKQHAQIVKDLSKRRQILATANLMSSLAWKTDTRILDVMEEVNKAVLELSEEKSTSVPVPVEDMMASVQKIIRETCEGLRENRGFFSSFGDLDKIVAGFQPGSLNILAARPSMGKTALALNMSQFGGRRNFNGTVLFFSLEMTAEQLTFRMLSAQTGIPLSDLFAGNLTPNERQKVERTQLHGIFLRENSDLTALDFRSQCRRFKMRHPELSLIVVDYLQLMDSGKKNTYNRQYEVADISRILKTTALELDCPVLALSQLSRETERRVEKKPQLSDLRDSGAIEQDADTVMLLYRDDYYDDNNFQLNSKATVHVAKNRNGGTGVCNLTFQREFTRFTNFGDD